MPAVGVDDEPGLLFGYLLYNQIASFLSFNHIANS